MPNSWVAARNASPGKFHTIKKREIQSRVAFLPGRACDPRVLEKKDFPEHSKTLGEHFKTPVVTSLFDEASVAIDGRKFKAVNTRDRHFMQAKIRSPPPRLSISRDVDAPAFPIDQPGVLAPVMSRQKDTP